MRRDGRLAEDFARRHHVPRSYDDADRLISDPDVDAAYVATRPGTHLEYGLKVASAGKPCYMEKPMARNATECRAMIDAFKQAKVPLFVGYYRRCLPKYVKLKELIDDGTVGAIETVSYSLMQRPPSAASAAELPWRWRAEESGGGVFLDMGCHALDLLDHLLGPARNVQGRAGRIGRTAEVEDRVDLAWEADNGVRGSARFSFTERDDPEDEFVFTGSTGRLIAPCFQPGPIVIENQNGARDLLDIPHPPHVHQPMIQTVVDELLGKGNCPSPSESALRTSEVMDAALNDYYGGRDDAFWERPESWPGKSL